MLLVSKVSDGAVIQSEARPTVMRCNQYFKMCEYILKYKPYRSNFELSSKWILTKNPNLKIFFFLGGGGGGAGLQGRVWNTLQL